MFVFMDLEASIMQLNGEFELQLTIEDRVEGDGEGVLTLMLANQLSMIEVFGNTWTIPSHSISIPSRSCHSIPISCCATSQPTK